MTKWHRKPNWWLYYRDFLVACWYSDTKSQAKVLANAHVDAAKERNNLKAKKFRVYKKDFRLEQSAKGEHDGTDAIPQKINTNLRSSAKKAAT